MSRMILWCKMRDNGFGPMTLAECRKTFHCDEDGCDCNNCPCLKVELEPRPRSYLEPGVKKGKVYFATPRPLVAEDFST